MLTQNSCGFFVKKINFTKEEMEFFNVYNENDLLIYQSLLDKKKDTSIIISKRIYHENDLFRHENKVHCVNINYINNKQKYSMFGYCKGESDESKYHIDFSYLNSNFKLNNDTETKDLEILTLSQKSFNNVYKLVYKRAKFHEGTDNDPEIVYWDKKYGIIKYITFNGEIWERVNWN
ncbi:hypothetical protein SAMN05444671_4649 [Flavobacterium sp. CF108]|nr:hypothetical protein SAMN04487978_0137 [Flavobacterium sp. fv08]SHI00274.1 hypothetical protein SAMN05444671_4649 [Flavobacterium sp. CF108]